jgi:hypothetical protein
MQYRMTELLVRTGSISLKDDGAGSPCFSESHRRADFICFRVRKTQTSEKNGLGLQVSLLGRASRPVS